MRATQACTSLNEIADTADRHDSPDEDRPGRAIIVTGLLENLFHLFLYRCATVSNVSAEHCIRWQWQIRTSPILPSFLFYELETIRGRTNDALSATRRLNGIVSTEGRKNRRGCTRFRGFPRWAARQGGSNSSALDETSLRA